MEDSELLKKYNNIYLEIISRYKSYIEEQEGLSVAALPTLVTPEDENVQVVARSIKEKFPIYKTEENFLEAARFAIEYVKKTISPISLPFQFWLKPAETIRYAAGDRFDMAVLLCSLLLALGSSTAKVIIVSGESGSNFCVYFEFAGKLVVIEIDNGIKESMESAGTHLEKGMTEYSSMEELSKSLGISGNDEISAYEFNDKLYNDLV